jgi:glucose/mannose-6-phosphate isomerase
METIDKSNLRQVIIDSPAYFKDGLALAKDIKIQGVFKRLCISGMGGSSLPADVLNDLLSCSKELKSLEIIINRSYSLPQKAKNECLNIFASYSGSTEETVSSFNEAIREKLPSLAIAHGGKILEMSKQNGIDCLMLPEVIQPRYALNYFIAILTTLAANLGFIKDISDDILASLNEVSKKMDNLEEQGKTLSEKLFKKTPVIHTTFRYESLARIWKIKINENAKTPAFYNVYPELNHNEMLGYTLPQADFHIIALSDRKDHSQIIKRMEITAKLLQKKGIETSTVDITDSNFLNTLFTGLVLGDWTSYYLALAYNQDPTPVEMVEDLKKLLV